MCHNFEYFVKRHPCLLYFTEGAYDKLLGINTLDTGINNVKRVMNYGKSLYNLTGPINSIMPYDGNTNNSCLKPSDAMKTGQIHKFQWIVTNVMIKPNDRVLEIGFGNLDLMRYLRDVIGADVVGINLSTEQVKHAKRIQIYVI